jgi:large subunit ribosomal protein L4
METVTKKTTPITKPVKSTTPKVKVEKKVAVKSTEAPVKKLSSKERSLKAKAELKPLNNKVALAKEVFEIENVNNQAMFDTILSERGSRRQGTHAVKTRATVSGTGKKP